LVCLDAAKIIDARRKTVFVVENHYLALVLDRISSTRSTMSIQGPTASARFEVIADTYVRAGAQTLNFRRLRRRQYSLCLSA